MPYLTSVSYGEASDQAVLALDLAGLQAAESGVEPAARGEGPHDQHLVAAGRVVEADADRVVVRAHVQRILVRERHVEDRARPAAFACRRHPGLAAAHRVADRVRCGV